MRCQHYAKYSHAIQRLVSKQTSWSLHSTPFSIIRYSIPSHSYATVIHAQNRNLQTTDQKALQNIVVRPNIDHHRSNLDKSLSRLSVKDLSALLAATGRPSSGLKSILADRLASYLNAIAHQVDGLKSEVYNQGDLDEVMSDSSIQNRDESMFNQVLQQILPQSIISIDIGIRNLAWVELSRDGEILRWAIEDLMSPSDHNGITPEDESTSAGAITCEASTKSNKTKTSTRKKRKAASIPFDSSAG
ncbi:hypothetical protein BGZ76_011514 [Entomortierella beljakovae]|nr:hypothetical protein BGZ76_011514 [Entomortierella beljakovae]